MAILGSVFAIFGRLAGKLLNSALGWATILLFGKVEGRRQILLLVIALGSLVWVLTLVGIALPEVGAFLLAFVPIPDFVDDNLVRLIMLGLALLVPLLVGVAALFVAEPGARPEGAAILKAVLRGYPFTFILALTIAILAGVSVVRKAHSLARHWQDAHVPVVIKPGGYEQVLVDLEDVLDRAELSVERRPAPRVLAIPARLLEAVSGDTIDRLVPDQLIRLVGKDLEVLVYPSDIAIAGAGTAVARARAAIATELTTSPAYLTTSAEAERVEDEIAAIAQADRQDPPLDALALRDRLQALDRRIATLAVPFDEWETVYRQRLQVERNLLARQLDERPIAVFDETPPPTRATGWAIGLAGVALIVLDVGLLIADRFGPKRS